MIACKDSCGSEVEDAEAASAAGWSYLEISKTYRCGACWRALNAASSMVGTAGQTIDNLPKDSIGSIRKPTAETIAKPSVKP